MTERLYYTDAYARTFTARVTEIAPGGPDRPAGVVLDRTAFYPASGGQPHDTGTLGGGRVVDVVDAGDTVIHVLSHDGPAVLARPAPGLDVGAEVEGCIDWERRFDHMQQHTAQHLLSAAFLRVLGAETMAVHLGESSTLDLEIPALIAEDAPRVEEVVNQVVFENRPVTVRFIGEAEAAALGLRRPPRRTGTLRVVEVADFDRSACGGTHVRDTAEIGPVLIRRWERTRGRIRVEFLAGWRAVRDYRWKHVLVSDWSARFGVRDRELGDALLRREGEAEARERALEAARKRLVGYEAAERLASVPVGPGRKIVRLEFPEREPHEIRWLLREITATEPSLVLAGVRDTGRLYFSRSPGDGPDLSAVLGRVCRAVGGRGGGTAEFAQGVVPPGEAVARALTLAEEEARGA